MIILDVTSDDPRHDAAGIFSVDTHHYPLEFNEALSLVAHLLRDDDTSQVSLIRSDCVVIEAALGDWLDQYLILEPMPVGWTRLRYVLRPSESDEYERIGRRYGDLVRVSCSILRGSYPEHAATPQVLDVAFRHARLAA